MAEKKINVGLAKVGMQKDAHPSQLTEEQYTHAKNANTENESGNAINITNEKSNILASKFKEGFVVINQTNDIDTNNTYFFLLNPETGVGEFGVLENNQNVNDLEDLTVNCTECHQIKELATPLEEIDQVELQTYTTLISDACKEDKTEGFNFNINNPIKKTVIKNEKCGKTIYFSHKGNPPRYINIDKIEDYYIDDVACADDAVLDCSNFDMMRVFKLHSIPKLSPTSIELGGNLRMGVYEFLVAYCDSLGNETSEYFSITNPISIFDRNNNILAQPNLADRTGFAIRLDVSNLDKDFTHYKVAVIQTADIEGASRYFIEGIHPINDTTVLYATEQNKLETSIDNLARITLKVEEAEAVDTANNILYQYGITNKKEINLQPIVNLLGSFVKWQTHIATENLYVDGVVASKFLGYNRDEVVPFGIKFLLEGGYETAVFPFIARPPKETDLEFLVETDEEGNLIYDENGDLIPLDDNQDVASILANKGQCNTSNRVRRWQYYNTAELDAEQPLCDVGDIETVTVTEEITRFCIVEDIATIPAGTLSIPANEEFSSLEDYINDNKSDNEIDCDEAFITSTEDICGYLYADYSAVECAEDPYEGLACETPDVISEVVEVSEITGEIVTKIEKIFGEEYLKVAPVESCRPYKYDANGNFAEDDDEETGYGAGGFQAYILESPIYKRDSDFSNESCSYAAKIIEITDPLTNIAPAYFNNYKGSEVLADLYTTKIAGVTDTGFYTNMHEGGLWFVGDTLGRDKFIVEVSKQRDSSTVEFFDSGTQTVRFSLFKSCTASTAIYSEIIDLNSGSIFLLEKSGSDLIITKENGTVLATIVGGWLGNNNFYVVIDNKIVTKLIDINPGVGETLVARYYTKPTKGCYTVTTRNIEYSRIDITWDTITLRKKIELKSTCTFEEPIAQNCTANPYKKGSFAYWESEATYPDNNELFNSSSLVIAQADIPLNIRAEFEENFVDSVVEGSYIWKEDLDGKELIDFTCRNIRHYKFPDNKIAPFMYENVKAGFSSTPIFPLGVTIDETLINTFLDIAVSNNLISEKDRQNITAYEIVRGDLTLNRSIVASGLLYDMRKYQKKQNGEYLLYSNYPYNSYADDKFNLPYSTENRSDLGEGAVWGESNRNYTFHSPETDYYKPTIPGEMSVQSYMFGQSKGFFDEVEKHPKWVILTSKARTLAGTLATLEVITEIAIYAASFAETYRFSFFAGAGSTGSDINPVGAFLSTVAQVLVTANFVITKYGRYRYEWLKIFRDLGTPYNFAYYYFSEGNYNYLQNLQEEGNYLRGLNLGKYLTQGEFKTNNEITGEKLTINNTFREGSVLLSTGKHPLVYPASGYTEFDKTSFTSSLTYSSENGISDSGRSSEVIKNIASPYVALKNYLVDQHGTINSIKWLTTGYRGDLLNPQESCISIFGGDTFISRYTLKRKHAQFLINSMWQADRTPFNYFFYNNIGRNPKFYVSYNIDKDFSSGSTLFPDIVDEFFFDNGTRGGNYYRPPSKFYLYYYGVPNFLCESRINTNYRYAEKELNRQFYPQVGDLGEWTQESKVSIREDNYFFYNRNYSKRVTPLKLRTLADNYKKELNDCKQDFPNGVIASLPDNSENNDFDPWLIYRPLDFYEFRTDFGKLIDLKGVENEAILARFENTSILYNKVDYTNDDGQNPNKTFLGGTVFFQRRSASFVNSQLGFGGTQNTSNVSCEFGHFHVDAKRGQVIQMPPQGGQMEEISSFIQGKPSGMRQWFKEHLPFKILKYFKDVDVDNAYNAVGITMGWDSRYRRVFITKKDYIPKNEDITHLNGKYFLGEVEVSLTDETYFESVSWTIAYSPVLGSWMSFYDFKPNYYISHNNYFQTGINKQGDEFGLWSHLLTNKSYGVFYGNKYSFDVEYPIKAEYVTKRLNSVELWTEAKRYHNEYDWAINPMITFNKSLIHNNVVCSGYLNLIPQKNNFVQNKNYPKTNSDNTQDILITNKDNFKFSYNYFYNRVLSNTSNVAFINYDKNQIEKYLDGSIVQFKGKRLLDPLSGDFFLNRVSFDKDSRYSLTLKFTLNKTEV